MQADLNASGEEQWGGWKPIAAGLLIAVSAPLLGLCPILAWFALGMGEFSLGYLTVPSTILSAYFFGAAQSVIAGLWVGLPIQRHGWISLRHWIALSVVLGGLAPVVLLLMNSGTQPRGTGLIYISDLSITCYFIAAALFASLVLRLLIVRLGWMRRPEPRRLS